MLKQQTEHFNPCRKKIMFPLLRKSGKSRQSRPQSMKGSSRQNISINITPDSKQRRTCSEGKTGESTNKSSESDIIFLKKCYQHVLIQNSCLNRQIVVKQQQLQNLHRELAQIKKQKSKNKHPIDFESFGNINIVASAQSEQQCSLQFNMAENTKNEICDLKQELQSLELTRFDRFKNKRGVSNKNI